MRFVIYGLSPLTVGVSEALEAAGHRVSVVYSGSPPEELPAGCRAVTLAAPVWEELLRDCTCLLTLEPEERRNLKVALLAHRVAPAVPVVMRTFDASMAEALQQGANVRRAYSLSALAAPAFVSAVLGAELLASLGLGEEQVVLCQINLTRSVARTELEQEFQCRCLGEYPEELPAGSPVVLAGLQDHVLAAAAAHHPPGNTGPVPRPPAPPRSHTETQLGMAVAVLCSVLLLACLVFWRTLHLSPIDAFYFVVTTATTTGYGDISLKDAPAWVKLFGCLVMVSGGGLVAVLFSHLAALVTQDRLEERLGRRARQMRHHVILVGLGRIGYRVEQLLADLGIPCVVLDTERSVFSEAARSRSVVLQGDARLPEDLQRAGISQARAFLACTDDDLANLQCCLQARRGNASIYTVTRTVDSELADSLGAAFGINCVVSPVGVAVAAFVGAATDERAMRRFFVQGKPYLAFRRAFEAGEEPGAGVTLLASEGHWGIVTGPEEAMIIP